MPVPDSTCTVATDRKYSIEHIWVLALENNVCILGITTTMVQILGEPYKMTFPDVGRVLARDEDFSSIEGYKLNADLLSPVSGKVLQINTFLRSFSGAHVMPPLLDDPYNTGWMIAVEMTRPEELTDLLTPQGYALRVKGAIE